MTGGILVVGSMNMDLVARAKRYPQKGETLMGKDFNMIPGGKGANQALACGKLGGNVKFIGSCGRDSFGDVLLQSLQQGSVNTEHVYRDENASTGVALITVEEDGDNRIIVIPGANGSLTPEKMDYLEGLFKEARVLLLQLEIPLKTALHTIKLARKYKIKIILDPAPAQKLPLEIYPHIDYLLPNEGELGLLLENFQNEPFERRARRLLELGAGTVIVTRGADGVSYFSKTVEKTLPAIKVEAVDTTAAGDAFAGAFALGVAREWDDEKSIKFASAVAALSVTKLGAQSSLPDIEEVESFIQERGLLE